MKEKLKNKERKLKGCTLLAPLFLFLLSSCGIDGRHFRVEGSFKSFNQGELYIYAANGEAHKLDTVGVRNGQFAYQVPLQSETTFVIVFPNYTELPVFGAPGTKVTIEGDASHLKELDVKGSKENELMTAFRMKTNELTPPEFTKAVAEFIMENPQSPASIWLLNKHFIQTPSPDYQQAIRLIDAIKKGDPENKNASLTDLRNKLADLNNLRERAKLPGFTATDINGKRVSNADFRAKANVINVWATWNYESLNIQRQLKRLEKDRGASQLHIMSICLDASQKECRRLNDRDSITWATICDGRMWETPVLAKLGLTSVPDNIVIDGQGRIIAHSLTSSDLSKKLEELLDK